MSAAVRVEPQAFTDPRFGILGRLLGVSRFDALGRMFHVWSWCTERQRHDIPVFFLAGMFDGDVEAFSSSVVAAELGAWLDCTEPENHPPGCRHIRIKGTAGRIEWLGERRRAAPAGGKARAASAQRDERGRMVGQPSSSQVAGDAPANTQPSDQPKSSALTPALALAPSEKKKNRAPAKPSRSVEVRSITLEVVEAFNRSFGRSLSPGGWEDSVSRVVSAGYSGAAIRGVVWWAAIEWPEGHDMRKTISPKTLLKLQSSQGYRTFREYLSCASEKWRETHGGERPPWEREAAQPRLGVVG